MSLCGSSLPRWGLGRLVGAPPITLGASGGRVSIIGSSFVPLVVLGARLGVVSRLDLELGGVRARRYPVGGLGGARGIQHSRGLLVLVVGGGGGVPAVGPGCRGGMGGLGGWAGGFTKSIADRLDLPFPRARSLKVDYARGLDIERKQDIAGIIGEDVRVWSAGVELVMEELSGGDLLPGRIFLCGGGSRLPEIREALAAEPFWKQMPFARPPEVTVLSPDQIDTVVDATDLLVDQQDVTPLGLAYQAIELQTTADPLDVALKRVLRAMKV